MFEVRLSAELNMNVIAFADSLRVLFTGMQSGEVLALDSDTGDVLRSTKVADVLVSSLVWVDSAGRLIAGMKDGMLAAVDGSTGARIGSVRENSAGIFQLVYAPRQRLLIHGSTTGDVCARDPFSENGLQQLFRLNLGAKFVMALCVSNRAEELFASRMDGRITLVALPQAAASMAHACVRCVCQADAHAA